jgi:hypothetical protein
MGDRNPLNYLFICCDLVGLLHQFGLLLVLLSLTHLFIFIFIFIFWGGAFFYKIGGVVI